MPARKRRKAVDASRNGRASKTGTGVGTAGAVGPVQLCDAGHVADESTEAANDVLRGMNDYAGRNMRHPAARVSSARARAAACPSPAPLPPPRTRPRRSSARSIRVSARAQFREMAGRLVPTLAVAFERIEQLFARDLSHDAGAVELTIRQFTYA